MRKDVNPFSRALFRLLRVRQISDNEIPVAIVNESSKPCVLVVDDSANFRRIICLYLQSNGYTTVEAQDGLQAMDIARKGQVGAALFDVMMPGMNGFTACKTLKEDAATRELPVLLCTAANRKEDLIAAIRAGADNYIVKPCMRETVLERLEATLRSRQPAHSDHSPHVDRRSLRRPATSWAVSWGLSGGRSTQPVYKAPLVDLSPHGFSFVFPRCGVCTGYEQGTVHAQCLLAPHAWRFAESNPIEFILSAREIIVEALGQIAHVYQWTRNSKTEKVGVAFQSLSPRDREIVEQFVGGTLEV